jgi:hypothetical protein
MNTLLKTVLCSSAFAAACLATSAQAAVVYDLSTTSTVVVNTTYGPAIFTTDFTKPTGTGVFQPFLSIQANGVEQGYNTSAKQGVFDTKREPQYNHEIRVSDLNQITIDGAQYYSFLIDINEPNAGDKSLITLDSLKLFTSTKAGQTTNNVESLGVKRFDLDLPADSYIRYDDLNSGSGQGDIAFFIPVSAFAGARSTDYVYMYQKFGESDATGTTQGGFEETAIFRPIPEVGSILPLAGVLGMVVGANHFGRRRRQSSAS